jgi:hypothetical protein
MAKAKKANIKTKQKQRNAARGPGGEICPADFLMFI